MGRMEGLCKPQGSHVSVRGFLLVTPALFPESWAQAMLLKAMAAKHVISQLQSWPRAFAPSPHSVALAPLACRTPEFTLHCGHQNHTMGRQDSGAACTPKLWQWGPGSLVP